MHLSDAQKEKFYNFQKIVRNSAKCLKCNDDLVSTHRHDFNSCSCGAVSVDGGNDYIRRAGNFSVMEDTSVFEWWSLIDVNNELEYVATRIGSSGSDYYEMRQELLLEFKKCLES